MPDHTQRFTGRAADYDRYRQRYPTQEILTRLRTWCGLTPSWIVADIGAGTGMLAEVFLENSNRVIAVEPNADMRNQMRAFIEGHLGRPAPQLEVLDATAEATTLRDASVDLVAVGRAFHWFDKERALAEFRRILKPGGWVTLAAIDQTRDPADPAFAAFERLIETHGTDFTEVRAGYLTYENMETLLGGAEFHQAQLHDVRQVDWPTFRGQAMSTSITPPQGHPNHEVFFVELRRFFETYAVDGILNIPTTCWITAASFRA